MGVLRSEINEETTKMQFKLSREKKFVNFRYKPKSSQCRAMFDLSQRTRVLD